MRIKVKGRRIKSDDNFITILDPETKTLYDICTRGKGWGSRKVGQLFANGFLFTQELFDKWYQESPYPETEETFVLED